MAVNTLVPAAQYVRMSTDHQVYSTANQLDAIARYADLRGYEIVATYGDPGKSGLTLAKRSSLRSLFADVMAGGHGFRALLVYDVSRWGRFQDTDESAHYEWLLRRAGVAVHYVAEPFENDGTPLAAMAKSVKRSMAAEHSRELAVKVSAGKRRIAAAGFLQGSSAGYGLRRQVIDEAGNPVAILKPGQSKAVRQHKTILVPGPKHETDVVRDIFRLYADEDLTPQQITDWLNGKQIPDERGNPWRRQTVSRLLANEKYIGVNVWGRTRANLGQRIRPIPESEWLRREAAFEAVIATDLFKRAEAKRRRLHRRYVSNDDLLESLRTLWRKHGQITERLLLETPGMPSPMTYRRVGGLLRAYKLIGYEPERRLQYVYAKDRARWMERQVQDVLTSKMAAAGADVLTNYANSVVTINSVFSFAVVAVTCWAGEVRNRTPTWFSRRVKEPGDITLFLLLNSEATAVVHHYLVPREWFANGKLRITEGLREPASCLHAGSPDVVLALAERVRVSEVPLLRPRPVTIFGLRYARLATLKRQNEARGELMRDFVAAAESVHSRLLRFIRCLHMLVGDAHMLTLLRSESLDAMPRRLFERLGKPFEPHVWAHSRSHTYAQPFDRRFEAAKAAYGDDRLDVMQAVGYTRLLLSREAVARLVGRLYPRVLLELQRLLNEHNRALSRAGVSDLRTSAASGSVERRCATHA